LRRFVGYRRQTPRAEQPDERPSYTGIIVDDVHQTIRGHPTSLGSGRKEWQSTGSAAINWIKPGLLSDNNGEGFRTLTTIICPFERSRELPLERLGECFHVAAKFDPDHDGTGSFSDAGET
jgi:hypothetical protein